ncbi:NXPE family member 3-like protein [Labeo rohita]|uniref:NXPE family member 3-like protein n=1 Tax=Labeo rohita TaxID=84645 RepID=A0A498LYP5_LABRO|nr:NXPE family member 3-like protein [Labeo rohita]
MGISDEEWERLQKIIEWPVPDQEITHLNQSTSPVHSSFSNNPSTISASDMGISDEEWKRLQKDIEWPGPDQEITHLDQSTSPVHSSFSIVGLKESYKVGEKISVAITARDHNKNLKRYGGDFFKAKLFNSELKASMYGEVVDHRNGTYSVDFLLPWEGTVEKCRSGLTTPVPAGFYLKDVWKSFVCNTRQFSPEQIGSCLKNKIVYLMGDSTTRQWFEYFEKIVPGKVMPIIDLHYISNDIDEIAGGPHAVVVFTYCAHLVFHPITFYVFEVAKIRQSVLALLSRAPYTTVIIKSGNTTGRKALWAMNGEIHIKQFQPIRHKPVPRSNNSSIISASDMGISDEEWERLQKALDWPIPDQITYLNQSTSPVHSSFSVVGLKESYKVGEKISVTITARDHNNNLKRYGGDFFKAKLFNSELKASVYGEVVDHRNGTYSVDLLLPWEGQARVFVRLEHSSEVVQILKKYRDSSFPRSHFNGYFESGPSKTRIREVVECNLKWGADGGWKKGNCCCQARVFVRLEHSSEVVQILKKYRDSSFPRSHFNGYFESGPSKTRIREVVECNLKWGADGGWKKGNCCLAKIRQSVVALLSRAPDTTVIIKSGNTIGRKVSFLTFQS